MAHLVVLDTFSLTLARFAAILAGQPTSAAPESIMIPRFASFLPGSLLEKWKYRNISIKEREFRFSGHISERKVWIKRIALSQKIHTTPTKRSCSTNDNGRAVGRRNGSR